MERKTSCTEDGENDGELTTSQIKKKGQEIAKRIEKYQGKYSSSRCNTPLPISSAESIESIHSGIGETSEKVLLFRKCLEKDRKLVENSKIDEQTYDDDNDNQAIGDKCDVQGEKDIHDAEYYENIISEQLQKENLDYLKNQVDELNEKIKNYENDLGKKDIALQMKIGKIDSLNKTIVSNNNLHLETVEELKKTHVEAIREERMRCTQNINHIVNEMAELKNNLDYVQHMCDELKTDNFEIEKENNELRKREMDLRIDVENLSMSHENEIKLKKLLKRNHESSKRIIENREKELMDFKQENESLIQRITFLESNTMDNQKDDNFQTRLERKEAEINYLKIEYDKLHKQFEHNLEFSKNIMDSTNKELLRYKQKNESLVEHMAFLENNTVDKQEKDNLQAHLTRKEAEVHHLKLENEKLNKQLQYNHESAKNIVENMKKELLRFKKENGSLNEHITLLQNTRLQQEDEHFQTQYNLTEAKLQSLNLGFNKLYEQLQLDHKISKEIIENVLKELTRLRQENKTLVNRNNFLENKPMDDIEDDNLQTHLDNCFIVDETELQRLNLEYEKLSEQYELNQKSAKEMVENVEKEMMHVKQKNKSLNERMNVGKLKSTDNLENDNLQTHPNMKDAEIQRLNLEYEKLNKQFELHKKSSKEIIENVEKELLYFKHENKSLADRIHFLENNSMDDLENDNLQTHLNMKDAEIQRLNLEHEKLNKQYELNQKSAKEIIENVDQELLYYKHENKSLADRIHFLENNSLDDLENDNLQKHLNMKDAEIQRLNLEHEKLNKQFELNQKSSKEIIENVEKELLYFKHENKSLADRIHFLENNSMDDLENDNLQTHLNMKDAEIQRLNLENEKLNKQFELNQKSAKEIIENVEKELLYFKHENKSLTDRIHFLENNLMDDQEKHNLQTHINMKDAEIQRLNLEYEKLNKQLEHDNKSSKEVIENTKEELLHFKQENETLVKHINCIENNSMDDQVKDNLQTHLNMKDAEIQRLNHEFEKLNLQLESRTLENQQTESRWIQLKNAYLNDKDRMSALEKVIDELKINNDELNSTNLKLTNQTKSLKGKLTALNTENSTHKERIAYLINVIELEAKKYQEAMKKASLEYEMDKNELSQQHDDNKVLLLSCNNKLEENTVKLNEVNNHLDLVLKENNSYKYECLELNNRLSKSDAQIFELNNVISELHNQIFQITFELESLKKENITLSGRLNESETEDQKLLSERFQKQNKLLKVKVKALKESENNRLFLQEQVASLTNDIHASNVKSDNLTQSNKEITTVIQNCELELQNCYQLLSAIEKNSSAQIQHIYTLRGILISLAPLYSFDDCIESNVDLNKIVNKICNSVPNDLELHVCIKKLILGSVHMLEYIMNLNSIHKHSEAELIARTEVEKLVTEAVDKVKLSTQHEYCKQNNEMVNLIENLQNDNCALKLNISSRVLETKEALTDLHGPKEECLLSLENLDMKNIKNENNALKEFIKNIKERLGMMNTNEINNMELQNSLTELEIVVQELQNENVLLKNQRLELEKSATIKSLEQPNIQKIDKYSNLNNQRAYDQSIEHSEESVDEEKQSLTSDNQLSNTNKSNSTVDPVVTNGDSKVLLARYKNLKTRFKDARVKTVELEKKVESLTCDLECANSKYKQLNNQYTDANEAHEVDIVQCQSEIENLMSEKLEAFRKLTALKEKHEILQNDYDQLKSNLDGNTSHDTETISPHVNEQNMILKRQLNEMQRLIDTAYSRVLCEWPSIDTDSDWVTVQSKKLDKIVDALADSKADSPNTYDKDFDLAESEAEIQLRSCLTAFRVLVVSIMTGERPVSHDVIINLMDVLKTYTELFIDFISLKNMSRTDLMDKLLNLSKLLHISGAEVNDESDILLSNKPLSSEKSIKPLNATDEKVKPSENEDVKQFQQSIAERDQLIKFLSDKISKSEYLNTNRNVDDIRLIRDKLDKALTAVHERDVRCDELTLELTRLLEERDMLQLKLSNSIRQIQLLSDDKSQSSPSKLLEEKYGLNTIDDKLEELHSLEYMRDAGLCTDQEQRHVSQMELHQSHPARPVTQEANSSGATGEASTSQSWFKDILW